MTSKLHHLTNVRIVLCQTSHPGNIGATARAMKTMGLRNLYLVSPRKFPDKEADAMACNAIDILETTHVCATLQEALTGCAFAIGLTARKRDLSHEMFSAQQAAIQAIQVAATQSVALVFGTEMSGLSNAELDLCQLLAFIPADPEFSSLNLAAAVQVMSYEMRMATQDGTIEKIDTAASMLAANEDVEGFYQHLEETLIKIGFLNADAPGRLMQRVRRIYARARLEKEEVNILRGILKHTQLPRPRARKSQEEN